MSDDLMSAGVRFALEYAVQSVARVAHEVNRAYCQATGDNSQPEWNDAPDWQKQSATAGVRAHLNSGFALTPKQSHESWMKQKADEGWKYGPVKDPETKEHPCFVPYDQLPQEQRVKDYLFRAVVHSMLRVTESV
ncbi:MAG TPA: RyR domain-containing protein [Burkholderiaceae bacterium]|nr:RyR domain-containing protein [Burkholderiaceae bacterium]